MNKTYIDTNDRRLVILMATALKICSTEKVLKYYNLGGLVFVSDITLPIKYIVYQELIRQLNQAYINSDIIHSNSKRDDNNFQVKYNDLKAEDKFMLNNRSAYKYETSFKGPFVITQCWTNGTVTRQYGAIKIVHNIRQVYTA